MQQITHRIAALIRQQPSISARRVAKALGYAEPKSVYYWLSKDGFTFNGFKDAVLSGAFGLTFGVVSQPLAAYGQAVVAEGFAADGVPVLSDQEPPFTWPLGARLLYRLPAGTPTGGVVLAGDWLVIGDVLGQVSRTLLLWVHGQPCIARQLSFGDRLLLLDEGTGRLLEPPFPPVIGPILAAVTLLTEPTPPRRR
ncbi:MAG: hypothetical protein ACYCO4_07825 [Sulfobacillus sp.]